jgi:multicomponent Na+:H+ antiporter subunit E
MVKRLAVFSTLFLLWLILTGGRAPGFGAVVAAIALWVAPTPAAAIRPLALPGFMGWFLLQSIKSGADVAYRALHPRLPIHPGMLYYSTDRLPPAARRLFVAAISLLPGTLSTHYDGKQVAVHLLDTRQNNRAGLDRLANRLSALFRASR